MQYADRPWSDRQLAARALRIRFGVCLVIASWLPIAQITID